MAQATELPVSDRLFRRLGWRVFGRVLAATYFVCLIASSANLAVWLETDGDLGVTFAAALDDAGSADRQDGWHPAQGDHDDPYVVVSIKLDTKSLKVTGAPLPASELAILAPAPAPTAHLTQCVAGPDRCVWARPPPRSDPGVLLRRTSVLLI
jgi:hypothetical protein